MGNNLSPEQKAFKDGLWAEARQGRVRGAKMQQFIDGGEAIKKKKIKN